jgi:hypothetical protein
VVVTTILLGVGFEILFRLDLDRLLGAEVMTGKTAVAAYCLQPHGPAIDQAYLLGETDVLAYPTPRARLIAIEREG